MPFSAAILHLSLSFLQADSCTTLHIMQLGTAINLALLMPPLVEVQIAREAAACAGLKLTEWHLSESVNSASRILSSHGFLLAAPGAALPEGARRAYWASPWAGFHT